MARIITLFLAIALLAVAEPAEARGVQFGEHDSLIFVTQTTAPGPNGPMALCHLTRTRTAMNMGYWLDYQGYVLSANQCAGPSYYTLPANKGVDEMVDGEIPGLTQDLALHYARGFFWLYVLPIFLIISALLRRRGKQKSKLRREALALEDGPIFRFIDAMCHAAKVNGDIDPAELQYITEVARDVADRDYSQEHIEYATFHCDKLKSAAQFRQFATGLNADQKRMVMRGVISVIYSDGHVDRREKAFMRNMSKAMGLRRRELKDMLSDRASPPRGAALA